MTIQAQDTNTNNNGSSAIGSQNVVAVRPPVVLIHGLWSNTGTTWPLLTQPSLATQVPTSGNLLPGQNASPAFNGTAGQTLSFNLLNSTIGTVYYSCASTVYDPSHINVGGGWCGAQSGNDLTGPVTLASTGTFTLYLAPGSGATGNVSVSVNNDQPIPRVRP